jgi:hypothetical protein
LGQKQITFFLFGMKKSHKKSHKNRTSKTKFTCQWERRGGGGGR